MADWHFRLATTWAELQAAHDHWVADYNYHRDALSVAAATAVGAGPGRLATGGPGPCSPRCARRRPAGIHAQLLPADVAEMAAFLASSRAGGVTGTMTNVTCGLVLR